ncbi:MAG: tetratricopeptide repeat protein [Candidatus Coatesbacteria bacterium]|nr:tetratricopeptide repeat protein [Candidatus Coatesbacteria bacterium]
MDNHRFLSISRLLGCLLVVALTATYAHSQDEASMYQFARRLYEDGEYQLAAKQLAQLISKYPSGEFIADAIFLNGCAQDNLGNYKEASSWLSRYITEFPSGPRLCEAMVLLGTNQRRMGHYSLAEQTFRDLLKKGRCEKQTEEATAKLAELLFIQDRFQEAIEHYGKLFLKGYSAQLGEALYEQYAQSLLAVSELDRARNAFKTLTEKSKNREIKARSLFNEAVTDYLAGDFKQSEKLFSSLLENFPNMDSATSASLGKIWSVYRQKDYQRAAAMLGDRQSRKEADFRLAERTVDAWENAALGDYDAAIRALRTILDEDRPIGAETRQDILQLIATWFEAKGDNLMAAAACEEMLALNTGSERRYENRFLLARNLLLGKELNRAETLFGELIEEDPFGPRIEECYLMLARASRMRMDSDQAVERYRSVSRSFPDSPVATEAELECAETLLEQGQPMEALPLLNSLRTRAGLTPELAERTQIALCRGLYAAKAFENCEASAESFVKNHPCSRYLSEALMLRGLSLRAIGSTKEALRTLEASRGEYLKRPPDKELLVGTLLACRSLSDFGKCASYVSELKKSHTLDAELSRILGFWDCYITRERGSAKEGGECFKELAHRCGDQDFASLCYVEASRCSGSLKRPANTAGYLSELISLEPGWPFVLLGQEGLRKALLEEGEAKKSLSAIAEFLEHEPGAFLEIARVQKEAQTAFNEGKPKNAARLVRKLIEANPESQLLYDSRLLLAQVNVAMKKFGAAEDALSPILSNDNVPPRVAQQSLALMGDIWYQRQKPRNAVERYKKLNHPVCDSRKEEALLLFRIGETYRQLGEQERAFEYYKTIVDDYENERGMCKELVVIGDNLRKMGRFELAQSALGMVIADDSCEVRYAVEAKFWFAHTLQEQKQFDEAILKYLDLSYTYTQEEAVPWVVSARANVGECYEAKGDYEEAIRVYQKIVEKYPGSLWSTQAQSRIDRIRERNAATDSEGAGQ